MSYIKILPSGKSQVAKDEAFCELLGNALPKNDVLFTKIFDEFDKTIRLKDRSITSAALSNVHGDWYEWILAIAAWNHFCTNPDSHLAILLPNVSQFDVTTLYEKHLTELIVDLKKKVSEASGVQLITSNPDFVIIDRNIAQKIVGEDSVINEFTPIILEKLAGVYKKFIGKCSFEQIVGYISVKTSLRPDRRLQIPHEGSLMKAIYAHLQTREWITNPKGLKYYAISTKMTIPDKKALATVATHSLTTVFSLPQAAVDEAFEVNTLQHADLVFSSILSLPQFASE